MDGSSALPPPPAPAGELVAQNGRLAGARRLLSDPLTLIGQAAACDVRLNVDSVAPFQCAILQGPAGPVLREVAPVPLTRVNGHPVTAARLQNGDVLDVGGFQFRVELQAPPTAELPTAGAVLAEQDTEALRVQAAAVAAQQAALTDLEARLEQRATALERQETQLAAHLAQQQQEIDEQREKLARDREAADAERAALARERGTLEREQAQLAPKRERLRKLRRRLFARYRRAAGQGDKEVARREAEATERVLQAERERAKVRAWFEKATGELELWKRQLEEQAQALALDQQRWDAALNEERAEQQRREQALAGAAHEVHAARQALAGEQKQWAEYHAWLAQETKGLEARIAAQRQRLETLERQVAALPPAGPAVRFIDSADAPATRPPSDPQQWPDRLREVYCFLSDQRAQLIEQWRKLLEVQQAWQAERDAAQAELERSAAALEAREGRLAQDERAAEAKQADLAQRAQTLEQRRWSLEGWHARLQMQEVAWRTQRDEAENKLSAREQQLDQRRRQYDVVHDRRNLLRQGELARLRAALTRHDEARRHYTDLWRTLDQQARAGDVPKADAASRHLAAALQRLDELAGALTRCEADLAERHQLCRQEAEELTARRAAGEAEVERAQQDVRQARAQQALAERQLRQLREELERLAREMFEEGGPTVSAANAA